jgi:GNAT superfamily N-acetyltransferase
MIRALVPGDRTVWEELFNSYAAFYKTTVSAEAKDVVWSWIFAENPDFWCDLAVDDAGQIVGMVQSDLFVRPEVRGGGHGRAMIDHVIGFARGRGIPNVRWLTQEFNYAGRRLYDTYRPRSDFVLYSVPVEG